MKKSPAAKRRSATCSEPAAPAPDKRQRILHGAIRVLARKGYQFATVAQIAGEAGVAKGLVHVYFDSKLDILLEVILLFMSRVTALIAEKTAALDCPVERLQAVFASFGELMSRESNDRYWGQILKEGLPADEELRDERLREKYGRIAALGRQLQQTLDGIIAEGQRRGLLDPGLKPQVIRQMLGGASQMLYDGLSREAHGRASAGYAEADVRQAMAALIEKFTVREKDARHGTRAAR